MHDDLTQKQNPAKNSFQLGKYKNVRIELHASWFFVVILLTYSLATVFFPMYFKNFSQTEYWIISIISALLLFISIFLHELAHSLTALRNNIHIEKITLFFFGGVSAMDDSTIDPNKELKIAIAGPLFSFILAIFFYAINYITTTSYPNLYINAISFYLMQLNLMIAIFNLVPGYPLDGGRIFRAIMWKITKDMRKATKYASNAGKAFAWLLIFIGVYLVFFEDNFAGLWYALLGVFLAFLANLSYQQVVIQEIFNKISYKDLLVTNIAPVEHELSLRTLSEKFLKSNQRSFLVTRKDKLIGFINADFLRRIPEYKWDIILAEEIAVKIDYIKVEKDTPLQQIFAYMLGRDLEFVVLTDKSKVLGIIEKNRLLNYVRLFS